MKLIFFVIAFCLVSVRFYFSWSGKDIRTGNKENIEIKANGLDERIEWLGHIELNESETAIRSISPGGYVKYAKNDTRFAAESNLKGLIEYSFSKGDDLSEAEKNRIMKEAIQELVLYGFDAKNRMERLYKEGGNAALITELGRVKLDNLQLMYMNRIFQADSLSDMDLATLTKLMRAVGSDADKAKFLAKFTISQLDIPDIRSAYFESIDSMRTDNMKQNVLVQLIRADSLSANVIDKILETTIRLGGSAEKKTVCDLLIDMTTLDEEQWGKLMAIGESLHTDVEKSDMLIHIAKKMPASETLKSCYLKAAKSIGSDLEYGKAMRAVDL